MRGPKWGQGLDADAELTAQHTLASWLAAQARDTEASVTMGHFSKFAHVGMGVLRVLFNTAIWLEYVRKGCFISSRNVLVYAVFVLDRKLLRGQPG